MSDHRERQSLQPGTVRADLRYLIIGGVVAAVLFNAAPASAEAQAFSLRTGVMFASVDTKVRVDPTRLNGNGAQIDLESDLGLGTSPEIIFVEANYRFAPRWTTSFQYLRLSRNRSVGLQREIQVGDTIYPVSANIRSTFSTNLYKAHVAWSFYKTDRAEAGLSVGAHMTDFRLVVDGQGTVGGLGGAAREERRDVLAPLPNAGLFGSFEVAPRLTVSAKANYFQLKIDNVSGGLTDLEANVAYQAMTNLAIGAGYRSLGYRLDAERANFEGSIRYKFNGPFLFVTGSF